MPAFLKFAILAGVLAAAGYVGMYVLAVHFEPEQKEVRKSLPSIKIQR
ncbi:MAG: histidine kinase [Pseudomonadota bacterium]